MNKKTFCRVLALIAVAALMMLVFTGCATADTSASASGDASASSSLMSFLPFIILIAVFYFFMIRPENKKKKKLQEMRNELGAGDQITTIGGMVGKIVSVDDDLITFETGADRVRIQVTKWAISTNSVDKGENNK